jgi:hypothetical protein
LGQVEPRDVDYRVDTNLLAVTQTQLNHNVLMDSHGIAVHEYYAILWRFIKSRWFPTNYHLVSPSARFFLGFVPGVAAFGCTEELLKES